MANDTSWSRRRFLANTAAGVAGLGLTGAIGGSPAAVGAPLPSMASRRSVVVLGGGVAGLTAAQELVERGFGVTVLERRALGGKARSMGAPNTGRDGRADLPGEHGFRFFGGFYKNLPDTLRRIPFAGNRNGVYDNLTATSQFLLARNGGREDLVVPAELSMNGLPLTPDTLARTLRGYLEVGLRLPLPEVAYFVQRLLVYFTSCQERRWGQWEQKPWWEFIKAARMSPEYQRMLGVGLTRNVVATKAEHASTNTVALMAEAFMFTAMGRDREAAEVDRILDGPTNEAWIDPWRTYLEQQGVTFRVGWDVRALRYSGGRVVSATAVDQQGVRQVVPADWFVCAVPIERAVPLWNADLLAADPQLRRAQRLQTDWMVGLQFYLREPVPVVRGHVNYTDSPWSITSISQAQYWRRHDFRRDFGDGTVRDCLSVDISEWNQPGILHRKTAKECTRQQIAEEVWAQLKDSLNDTGRQVLSDSVQHSWFLDPGIVQSPGQPTRNEDPLLIHPVGTWDLRPEAATRIPNFFLAADYVRNNIELATMEGANEAARQAVNALLAESGSRETPCRLWSLYQAPELAPFKAQDRINYRLGLRNAFDLG